jgi:hypothetical protein
MHSYSWRKQIKYKLLKGNISSEEYFCPEKIWVRILSCLWQRHEENMKVASESDLEAYYIRVSDLRSYTRSHLCLKIKPVNRLSAHKFYALSYRQNLQGQICKPCGKQFSNRKFLNFRYYRDFKIWRLKTHWTKLKLCAPMRYVHDINPATLMLKTITKNFTFLTVFNYSAWQSVAGRYNVTSNDSKLWLSTVSLMDSKIYLLLVFENDVYPLNTTHYRNRYIFLYLCRSDVAPNMRIWLSAITPEFCWLFDKTEEHHSSL